MLVNLAVQGSDQTASQAPDNHLGLDLNPVIC